MSICNDDTFALSLRNRTSCHTTRSVLLTMCFSVQKTKVKSPPPPSQSPSVRVRTARSPNVKRRPKSEFIPAAFLVEEDAEATAAVIVSPLGKSSPAGDAVNPGKTGPFGEQQPRPRSSAVLTPCDIDKDGEDNESSEVSDSDDSDHVVISSDVTITSVARTLFVCRAEHESELSFQPGEVIKNVEKSDEPGWLRGTLNGRTGLFPANYVQFE